MRSPIAMSLLFCLACKAEEKPVEQHPVETAKPTASDAPKPGPPS